MIETLEKKKDEWLKLKIGFVASELTKVQKDLTELASKHTEQFGSLILGEPFIIREVKECMFTIPQQVQQLTEVVHKFAQPYEYREMIDHYEKCPHCFVVAVKIIHDSASVVNNRQLVMSRNTLYELQGMPPVIPDVNQPWLMTQIRTAIPGITKSICELKTLTSKEICHTPKAGGLIEAASKNALIQQAQAAKIDTHWYLQGFNLDLNGRNERLLPVLDHAAECHMCSIRFAFDDLYDERIFEATLDAHIALENRKRRRQ